jgi:hypothetical protein
MKKDQMDTQSFAYEPTTPSEAVLTSPDASSELLKRLPDD